jgi:hypothetical protein
MLSSKCELSVLAKIKPATPIPVYVAPIKIKLITFNFFFS